MITFWVVACGSAQNARSSAACFSVDARSCCCALPHATTQKVTSELLTKAPNTKVCDLSADFRLHDVAAYARW